MEQIELCVCCHTHTHSQLGAYARRAVGTQHLRPRGWGSVPTLLLAGCHPSILSLKTSLPLFLILHPCIFTPPYSSETLQALSCPHIFFTHRLSKHTGDPIYLFFLYALDIQYSCGIELKASGKQCCSSTGPLQEKHNISECSVVDSELIRLTWLLNLLHFKVRFCISPHWCLICKEFWKHELDCFHCFTSCNWYKQCSMKLSPV